MAGKIEAEGGSKGCGGESAEGASKQQTTTGSLPFDPDILNGPDERQQLLLDMQDPWAVVRFGKYTMAQLKELAELRRKQKRREGLPMNPPLEFEDTSRYAARNKRRQANPWAVFRSDEATSERRTASLMRKATAPTASTEAPINPDALAVAPQPASSTTASKEGPMTAGVGTSSLYGKAASEGDKKAITGWPVAEEIVKGGLTNAEGAKIPAKSANDDNGKANQASAKQHPPNGPTLPSPASFTAMPPKLPIPSVSKQASASPSAAAAKSGKTAQPQTPETRSVKSAPKTGPLASSAKCVPSPESGVQETPRTSSAESAPKTRLSVKTVPPPESVKGAPQSKAMREPLIPKASNGPLSGGAKKTVAFGLTTSIPSSVAAKGKAGQAKAGPASGTPVNRSGAAAAASQTKHRSEARSQR